MGEISIGMLVFTINDVGNGQKAIKLQLKIRKGFIKGVKS
jgi:hypothetical protein